MAETDTKPAFTGLAPPQEKVVGPGGAKMDGGGPGTVRDTAQSPTTNWAELFWGSLGLPKNIVTHINQTFQQYPDATMAQEIAQNYLYTTPWFEQTFPGYAQGITAGLYSNVSGYQSYVNQMNTLAKQYNNAPVTTAEVVNAIHEGINPSTYGERLQGAAYVSANAALIQNQAGSFGPTDMKGINGQLTQQQLTAYGRQHAGLDSRLGEQVNTYLQRVQQRMNAMFSGRLASSGVSGGTAGPQSPSLLTGARANPATNVGAQ